MGCPCSPVVSGSWLLSEMVLFIQPSLSQYNNTGHEGSLMCVPLLDIQDGENQVCWDEAVFKRRGSPQCRQRGLAPGDKRASWAEAGRMGFLNGRHQV